MESVHHPDTHSVGPNGKAEKLPIAKLHSIQYLVALILAVLLVGLWRLQVLNADSFRSLAEANRIRKVPILAPRGKIFDREGRLIVDNYPSVTCYLLRDQVKDLDSDLPLISRGLDIPIDQIHATLRRYEIAPKYQPIPLKLDITPDEQAFIAAHRDELPGWRELLAHVKSEGTREVNVQRYKGLGEMNAEQLWSTTMNIETRTLLKVSLEDLVQADLIFTTLMGEDVESRRKFIEENALDVRNLDV